jgi:hypothetical protein
MSKPAKKPVSSANRVAAYRQRMRAAGLVQKTVWTYDTKDPAFIAEIDRQCRAIAADVEAEAEIMDWIERASEGVDLGPIPAYRLPTKR